MTAQRHNFNLRLPRRLFESVRELAELDGLTIHGEMLSLVNHALGVRLPPGAATPAIDSGNVGLPSPTAQARYEATSVSAS